MIKTSRFLLFLLVFIFSAARLEAATRSVTNNNVCAPNISLAVTIASANNVNSYAVEEDLPLGLAPSLIDTGGIWDQVNHKIKWGPFNDALSRNFTYQLSGADGTYTATGIESYNGDTELVTVGDQEIIIKCFGLDTVAAPVITPSDGTLAPVVGVAISSSTAGAEIRYATDGTVPDTNSLLYSTGAPLNFEVKTTLRARAFKAGMWASDTVTHTFPGADHFTSLNRSITGNDSCLIHADISVTPKAAVQSYALEETIPAGLTPVNFEIQGGVWDSVNRKIKWGPFSDSAPRTLSYDLSSLNDTASIVSGIASFNGENQPARIGGGNTVSFICNLPPGQVAAPLITPPNGSSVPVSGVTITSDTAGAEIRYAIDGTVPGTNSPLYSTPLSFSSETTLRVRAFKAGMWDSEITSLTYLNSPPTTTLTRDISLPFDCISNSKKINLTVTPTPSVQTYAVEEILSSDLTPSLIDNGGVWDLINHKIKWGPFSDNAGRIFSYELSGRNGKYILSGTSSFDGINYPSGVGDFSISCAPAPLQVEKPVINPEAGEVPVDVTITTAYPSDAEIRYTVDGSIPVSTSTLYQGALHLISKTHLRARAFKAGLLSSDTDSAFYSAPPPPMPVEMTSAVPVDTNTCSVGVNLQITPLIDLSTGSYAVQATLSAGLTPSAITDGGVWDPATRVVRWGPYNSDNTVRLLSYRVTGLSGAYDISSETSVDGAERVSGNGVVVIDCGEYKEAVETPTLTPPSGEVPIEVSINTATPGADIRYTIDGSIPDLASTVYVSPIPLYFSSETRLRARAFKAGMYESGLASALYSAVVAPPAQITRSLAGGGSCSPQVIVSIDPDETVSSYAVQESLPVGLNASTISHGGIWDLVNRTVKWGPFNNDNTPKAFTYAITGEQTGHTYLINGAASFDGKSTPLTATETAAPIGCEVPANLSALAGDGLVYLSWEPTISAAGYYIYYRTFDGSYGAPIDVGNQFDYLPVGRLINGAAYRFTVTAYDINGHETGRAISVVETPCATGCITLGDISFDKNFYRPLTLAETGRITFTAGDLNTNPLTVQTVNVKVTSASDLIGITITLAETDIDSGIFEGVLGFSEVGSNDLNDLIYFTNGNYITASYGYVTPNGLVTIKDTALVDTSPPQTFLNVKNGLVQRLGKDYARLDEIYSLNSNDPFSGVGRTVYCVDCIACGCAGDVTTPACVNGTPFNSYFRPFGFNSAGCHVIQYKSVDFAGNREVIKSREINVDATPARPTGVTGSRTVTFQVSLSWAGNPESDIKEYNIYRDGVVVGAVMHPADTYSETVFSTETLRYNVTAVDWLGFESPPSVTLPLDTFSPPLPVNPTINPNGYGTTVLLDWSSYDETLPGGITNYRVFQSTSPFSSIAGMTPVASLTTGQFSYQVAGLTKGQLYYFAVVAVGPDNNFDAAVTAVSGSPADVLSPEKPTNLAAQPFHTKVIFSWNPSLNSFGDLAGYKVYFDNATEAILLPATQTSYEKIGLVMATSYAFKVTSYDGDGNESVGEMTTVVTLLDNPLNLTVTPYSGRVDLSWSGVTSQYLKHYAVYAQETDFTTVEGLVPRVTVPGAATNLAGLTNGVTYYFAVTAINTTNGESKAVTTVSATPLADTTGPEISAVTIETTPVVDTMQITKPGTFVATATDPSGMGRVEFYIDGILVCTDTNGVDLYSCFWNIVPLTDGIHSLDIKAFDSLDNSTLLNFSLDVALSPPASPVILEPVSGAFVNKPAIQVAGTSENFTDIVLYNNSTQAGVPQPADGNGNFNFTLNLNEGENRIQAEARNRTGSSLRSAEVIVTLDSTLPPFPSNLTANPQEGGVIRVAWRAPPNTSIQGYNIYRANTDFVTPAEAVRINAIPVTTTFTDDLTPQDGAYYYKVSTVDRAGNESGLSGSVFATSDSISPKAISIQYTATGNSDPVTGRIAPGTVNLLLTLSEPVVVTPFLSITPGAGVPLSTGLGKDSPLTYSGSFTITENTPTGTAYAVFSARDMVGNRGTEIVTGNFLLIDSDGPSVTQLIVTPASPIKNNETNPASVSVSMELDEKVKVGTTPALSYLLSGAGRVETVAPILTEVVPQTGNAQAWQGLIQLPADAGLTEVETIQFIYQGADDLGNVSSRIMAPNQFQVYQGILPALNIPEGLLGEALPGGRVQLTWSPVPGASGYILYRQTPADTRLMEYVRVANLSTFTDSPPADGNYLYAIASIRQANTEEAISGQSVPVSVNADSAPPDAPLGLNLELIGNGIKANWTAALNSEPVTYSLYRSNQAKILSVAGLTPIASGLTQLAFVDPNPLQTHHAYVVTAVDNAGNESLPSNSFYLNFTLLPVSSLTVIQTESSPPVVSWTHENGAIAGYNLFIGPDLQPVKMNQTLLTASSFIDDGYVGDERRYTVIAVDSNGVESTGRSITLPAIETTLGAESTIKRGLMNRLTYLVENRAGSMVDNLSIKIMVDKYAHISQPFSVSAGGSQQIPVLVGGYSDLPDLTTLITTTEIVPNAGEKVEIIRSQELEIGNGILRVGLHNEEFIRGGAGLVQFTLENTGDEEIEIVTARNFGSAPSDEITLYLLDQDNNTLATAPYKHSIGNGAVTLQAGDTVVPIQPGQAFISEPITILTPSSLPDRLTIFLEIKRIHYHTGQADEVSFNGLSSSRGISLIETSYLGEIVTVAPASSRGNQPVVISGRAVNRRTMQALPRVPLDLIITLNGFERKYGVYTDGSGNFTYSFAPPPEESGLYSVAAVHPDLLDRPIQGQFAIEGVTIDPKLYNLVLPKNSEKQIDFKVTAGKTTTLTNLTLAYEAQDQPGGVFPQGIHITPGVPVANLNANQSATLSLAIWGDNNAANSGTVILRVKSDETGTDAWTTLPVSFRFSDISPSLFFMPDYLETAMAQGSVVTEIITLENRGTGPLHNMSLSLVDRNGNPAPSWMSLNIPADQGTLDAGWKRDVSINFTPPAAIPEGMYEYYLRVKGSNHRTTDIGLYVSINQSGIGSVLFKIEDIYTATLDASGALIQGLSGAKVHIQNEKIVSVDQTLLSDAGGEVLFADLPAGRYKGRITADNHEEKIARLWIKPGITVDEKVFLEYNLVTVEWDVAPTTIVDKYEVLLQAIYETDVPAPIVVADPLSITLPKMKPGDQFYGEIRFTNYGLVRADNLKFQLPQDTSFFKYEPIGSIPASLGAKESFILPYRITSIKSVAPTGAGGGGGVGCGPGCSSTVFLTYDYVCANKWKTSGKSTVHFHSSDCACSSGGASGGVIVSSGGIGGGGGSSGEVIITDGGGGNGDGVIDNSSGSGSGGVSTGPSYQSIGGSPCPTPGPERKGSCDAIQKLNSAVELLTGGYTDTLDDMTLKVAGHTIRIGRSYYDNTWHFGYSEQNLEFRHYGSKIPTPIFKADGTLEAVIKDGYTYSKSDEAGTVFSNVLGKIYYDSSTGTNPSFTWEDKYGNQAGYDASGHLLYLMNRYNQKLSIIYDTAGNGQLLGLADNSGIQKVWYEYDTAGNISAIQDIGGRRVAYTYTAQGLLSSVTDPSGVITHTYQYDPGGKIFSKTDGQGRVVNIAYNEFGYVSAFEDENRVSSYEYDFDKTRKEYYSRVVFAALNKTGISPSDYTIERWFNRDGEKIRTDVNGTTVERITKNGRVKTVTDSAGNETRLEYDEWNNLTKAIFADGTETHLTYDTNFSNVLRVVDEKNSITEYAYDSNGNRIKMTEAVGALLERVTEYAYDLSGNMVSLKRFMADGTASETLFEYDGNGNVISITGPMGAISLFTYDFMGNVVTSQNANGKIWSYTYDLSGRMTSVTDPPGNVTGVEYDNVGNVVRQTDANGQVTVYTYNKENKVTSITDPSGNRSDFSYSAVFGELLNQTDPEGKQVRINRDLAGRITGNMDGNSNETTYLYDNNSPVPCVLCNKASLKGVQPSEIITPSYTKKLSYDSRQRLVEESEVLSPTETFSTQYAYDLSGNLKTITDREGRVTSYEYDALNRLVKSIDPAGSTTENSYDTFGNLTSVKDGAGNVTTFEYDRNNRLIKETRPLGQMRTYQYDTIGNLTQQIDAKNQKTEYLYDDISRLSGTRYFSSFTDVAPAKTVTFTYNSTGSIKTYDDGTTSAEYFYDNSNRKTQETINYGTFSLTYSYTYYKNGLKKSFTGPDGITYEYTYDNNNQFTGVAIPGQGSILVNSYKWFRPDTITLPGGATKEYNYDPLMQVKTITAKTPGQNVLMNYGYTRDKEGNILSKNTQDGSHTYTYDNLYQLTTATNPAFADEAYTYDAVGNRVTKSGVPGDWTHNANNELQSYRGASYQYDSNGNMTQSTANGIVLNYFYDVKNRLIRVEDGNAQVIANYYYDPFGRRLWKETGGVKTFYLYSDEGLVGEFNGSGTEIKSYGYKPNSMWTSDPLFMKTGSQYYFYQNDHLGTPQMMTDASGAVVWSAQYAAFGEAMVDSASTISNDLMFPGQYYDEETGLHYNWHRYFDPRTGIYIQVDPIGFAGGDLNMFRYVGGNPVGFVDPTGKSSLKEILRLKPDEDEYVLGRDNDRWIPTGGRISRVLSDYGPFLHRFATYHDRFVEIQHFRGVSDLICNVPSMAPVFVFTILKDKDVNLHYDSLSDEKYFMIKGRIEF